MGYCDFLSKSSSNSVMSAGNVNVKLPRASFSNTAICANEGRVRIAGDGASTKEISKVAVNHTEVQETAEERKIFDVISGDHGDEQCQVFEDHRGEQGEAKVVDDGQTIGVMQQVEVCGEGEGQNDEVQISGDRRGEQGAAKLVDDEQEQVEPTIGVVHGGEQVGVCGEEEGEKGGVQVSEDDGSFETEFNTLPGSSAPEDNLFETDSGSTLVPNTLSQMSSPNTTPSASLNMICATIAEQGEKDANVLIDELKNKIENLEKEKQNVEIEIIKIQEQNEKALQSRNEENGMLKEVHQVMQHATFEKIARLQKEKNDAEDELTCIKVHEITQEITKENKKKLKKYKEQLSAGSMFKRVMQRDDRKQNYSEDYVYVQVKRESPQVDPIDEDNSPDYEQRQKGKKKMLKKLKVDTEVG
ncbi:hypothetical protein C3L33_02021, partial [Rhododendron williamsianum]